MNDERTIYDEPKAQSQTHDSEATQFDAAAAKSQSTATAAAKDGQKDQAQTKDTTWHKVAAGGGVGILLGSGAAILTSSAPADTTDGDDTPADEVEVQPEWSDGDVSVAAGASDSMSFGEAFAAARAEVGPGGAFEWHGNVYSTYTAEEWDAMTPAERADYESHFSWGGGSADTAAHDHAAHTATHHTVAHATAEDVADDDIDIVSVDEHGQADDPNIHTASEENIIGCHEPEVEILGVAHDYEHDVTIGGLTIDDQPVILVDVDNDEVFDIAAADTNADGQISEDEITDISDAHITVDDLGGFHTDAQPDLTQDDAIMSPDDSQFAAADDSIDYVDDGTFYEA